MLVVFECIKWWRKDFIFLAFKRNWRCNSECYAEKD